MSSGGGAVAERDRVSAGGGVWAWVCCAKRQKLPAVQREEKMLWKNWGSIWCVIYEKTWKNFVKYTKKTRNEKKDIASCINAW